VDACRDHLDVVHSRRADNLHCIPGASNGKGYVCTGTSQVSRSVLRTVGLWSLGNENSPSKQRKPPSNSSHGTTRHLTVLGSIARGANPPGHPLHNQAARSTDGQASADAASESPGPILRFCISPLKHHYPRLIRSLSDDVLSLNIDPLETARPPTVPAADNPINLSARCSSLDCEQKISALERELGVRSWNGRQALRPTESGRDFLPHCQQILVVGYYEPTTQILDVLTVRGPHCV
jgi:hypothetical protein